MHKEPAGGRRLHVLEVETFGRGGLIHYAFNLSKALAERGHAVTLVTAASYELADQETPEGVQVLRPIGRWAPAKGSRWPALLSNLARKVEAIADALTVTLLARRLRPDVIHIHCTNPASLVYHLFFRLLNIPLVATTHVVTPHEDMAAEGVIYRLIHRTPHHLIAHSEFDRRRLLDEFNIEPSRTAVIPHGEYGFFSAVGEEGEGATTPDRRATARQHLGLESDEEVVLFFGYIREYKGLDLLFEAWPTVANERPRVRLLIAGDPVQLPAERRRELEQWAESLGAVHHFGYVPFEDVSRYFAAADLLVMPYRRISQSGVLYLALALGVPVVATRVGALPEVLAEGESAVFVPPESPADLAQALARVLGDSELRGRLAAGGRRVAEEHSWPSIAGKAEEVFSGLLD